MFPFGRKSKLQRLLKELQIEIVAEALKFSVEVSDELERSFGRQGNQTILYMDALVFCVYSLGCYAHSDSLWKTVYEPTVLEMSRFFGKMIGSIKPELATESEAEWLNSLNIRRRELSKASSFHGENARDKNSVYWLAACAISANVGETENSWFELVIRTNLMKAIINLNFGQRVKAMNELL
jgi:hypothetical protein